MKLAKKLIALNLAFLLIFTMLPLTAWAASEDLRAGGPITFAEPNEDGYTFTPSETGVYTAMFATTVDNAVSGGNLLVYGTNGDELYGVRSIKGNWATYCRTLLLQRGKTYTIKCWPGYAKCNQYTLSIAKADCHALSSVPTRFNALEYYWDNLFFKYTPTKAGWYTISASPEIYLQAYDGDFEGIDSGMAGDLGLSLYLKSGQTYYLSASPDTSGTISVSTSNFPTLTTTSSTTITLGETFNYLTFTPTRSGSYTIKAETNNDYGVRYVYIFSDTQEYLAGEWDKEADYSAETTYNFTAGRTYYIGVHGADAESGVVTATYNEAPAGLAQWSTLSPANGATDVGYSGNNPPKFQITFDREIAAYASDQPWVANVDLISESAFAIYRASDNQLIYKPGKYGTFDYNIAYTPEKSTLSILPTRTASNNYELKPGTTYYITMGEGFVRFTDGTTNPAIMKGEWEFTTGGNAPSAPIQKTGSFNYDSALTNSMEKYEYFYDEAWFFQKGYQHDLARMSIRLAMSAASTSPTYVKDLYDQLGFEYTDKSINYPVPTADSIGYAIGSKQIADDNGDVVNLIVVAVRGGGYKQEWASNFTLGPTSEHMGFADAAYTVTTAVQDYIKDIGAKNKIKIWITGYSRAAATSNISAQRFNAWAKSGKVSGLTTDDIFAYCFECPRTVMTSDPSYMADAYSNIFNIVNYIDIVPKVAPEAWDYNRYGITYYVPSAEQTTKFSNAYEKMLYTYSQIANSAGISDGGSAAIWNAAYFKGQGAFFDKAADKLASFFGSPSIYTVGYEDTLRDIMKATNGGAYEIGTIVNLLVEGVPAFAVLHPVIVTKLIANLGNLSRAHYPELCLAWMDSLTGTSDFVNSRTRQLKINCPVNVAVYNSSGSLVAQIQDDVVSEVADSTIAAYIDDDNQKVVILPTDDAFTISVTATDDGDMTYQVIEYDVDIGATTRLVNYYNIEINNGDTLTGTVENLDATIRAEYPLVGADGTKVEVSVDLSEDVSTYLITVNSTGKGTVTGGGRYIVGEFSKVTATADEGESFLGWYVDDTLVSTDAEYRFLVEKAVNITAKFTQNSTSSDIPINPAPSYPIGGNSGGGSAPATHGITIPAVTGGTVTATPKSASKGSTITLTVTPDKGYEFVSLTVTGSTGNKLELVDKGTGKYTFVMPDSRVTVEVVFQLVPEQNEPQIPQEPEIPWVSPFTDVLAGEWYYDAVKFVSENSLMNGIDSNLFAPNTNLSRAQLAQILYNKESRPAVNGGSLFNDVAIGEWYTDAITWAAANNIVGGYGNGMFGPDDNITREQLAVMLWRYAGEPVANVAVTFNDADQISDFAQAAIRWAVENGILNGKGGNILDPKGFATRAEVAQMLKNYLDN